MNTRESVSLSESEGDGSNLTAQTNYKTLNRSFPNENQKQL